jgi:hypothetical protein
MRYSIMITNILRAGAVAAALAIVGTPAISSAATAYAPNKPVHVNYDTSIQNLYGFDYPWSGTLQLTFNPDGIITGYYRPADNGDLVPVTGGRNGENIWLDIGRSGRLHVTGTLQNGTIAGAAFEEGTMRQYKFNAKVS